jgi:integrase
MLGVYSGLVVVNQISPKVTEFATNGSKPVARENSSSDPLAQRKFGFTKKGLDKLPLPINQQRAYFYDEQTRGLALAVSPAGKKVFVLYRKVAGRPERITIGSYPDLSIEQARGKAAELNGAIARGENPASKRRLVRDESTLGELFDTYLEFHAKPYTKRWKGTQYLFNLHLKAWKLRKISDIRKMDVVALHARIGANSGKYTANRVVEVLSAMFNKAIAWDWQGVNPAAKVEPFRERQRERFLQPEELHAFAKALNAEANETVRDYIWISLLTGARRANVQAMRWDENLDLQKATWTIPETKSGETVTVTLPNKAVEILKARKLEILKAQEILSKSDKAVEILKAQKFLSKSEWVFSGVGKTGHLVEPKSAWKRIVKAAKIEDLRIHDLRRTLGSWQAAQGTSLQIIGKSLGHKSLAATAVYSRLNLDPVRASVNSAIDAMLLATKDTAGLLGDGK